MLDQALKYLDLGWSIIPVEPKGKNPIKGFLWKKYQTEKPTETEVRDWFKQFPDANIGIITGQISGLIVVDIDGDKGKTSALSLEMPSTIIAETGRGFHYFYKSNGSPISNKVGIFDGIDIRGDGGYVVAPPSIHASGKIYQWAEWCDPWENALSEPPAWINAALTGKPKEVEHIDLWKPAGEGERDSRLSSLAGRLFKLKIPDNDVFNILSNANLTYSPPLDRSQVLKIFHSIKKYHAPQKIEVSNDVAITATQLLSQPDEPISWAVENLWTTGGVGFISGESKSFKTYFAIDMALSIASGTACINHFPTKKSKVIYFIEEERGAEMRRRIRGFIKGKGEHHFNEDITNNIELVIQKRVSLDDENWKNWIIEKCDKNRGAFLFFDSFVRFHAKNENSSEDMKPLLKFLRDLQIDYGVSVAVLHHTRKPSAEKLDQRAHNDMRGTSDFAAWYDCFLGFKRTTNGNKVQVDVSLRDAPSCDPFMFDLYDDGDIEIVYSGTGNSNEIEISEVANSMERIVIANPEGISQVELDKSFSCRKEIVIKAHKVALGFGKIVRFKQGGKGNNAPYFWYPKEP